MFTLGTRLPLTFVIVALAIPCSAKSDSFPLTRKVCEKLDVTAFVAEVGSKCFVRKLHGSAADKERHQPALLEPLEAGDIIECSDSQAYLVITNCDGRESKRLTSEDMRGGGYIVPSVSTSDVEDPAVKAAARRANNLSGAGSSGAGSARSGSTLHPGTLGSPGVGNPFTSGHAALGAAGSAVQAASGSASRTRADGTRADIHDARLGMHIHHGLDGSRRVIVERLDRSKIVVDGPARGYVQRPHAFHGLEFALRTYRVHGRTYSRVYRSFPYHGVHLDVYAPTYYYPVGFYEWATRPWLAPVAYSWGWAGQPWFGFYRFYFAPYPFYLGAAYWQTDYLLASSLESAYAETMDSRAPDAEAAAESPLTEEVKQRLEFEVRSAIEEEGREATIYLGASQGLPAYRGIAEFLDGGVPHALVTGPALDVADVSGRECRLTPGDVIIVQGPIAPDATQVEATVVASKGSNKCSRSARITVGLGDLQDMQNHMRETIDLGLDELLAKQAAGVLPALPSNVMDLRIRAAYAVDSPSDAGSIEAEIAAQQQVADQVERDAAGVRENPSGKTATFALGQTIDQVVAAWGAPSKIIDLGSKKIYFYPDRKIIFTGGKITDIE